MDNPFSQVRTHGRRLPSGRMTTVRKHRRKNNYSESPFSNNKGIFHLPIKTGIIVPSTQNTDKPISNEQFEKRILETRQFLANTNGGFTSVRAVGGFTDEKGQLVKEDVVVVESFTTKDNFVKNKPVVRKFLSRKGKEWKQESIGYEYETDLYYVDSKK